MIPATSGGPGIAGRIALTGALKPARNPDGTRIFECGQAVEIYASEPGSRLVSEQGGGRFRAAFGRISNCTSSGAGDRAGGSALSRLLPDSLSAADASAIFVEVEPASADGPLAVRLSTDKYGFRPLYYLEQRDELIFASRLSLLLRLAGEDGKKAPSVSPDVLLHFYHFGFTPDDRTLLTGIRKVPAGCTLEVASGSATLRRYFSVGSLYNPAKFAVLPEAEVSRMIGDQLAASVGARARGVERSAVALSGGLDSGMIAGKLSELGTRTRGYTLTFAGAYSEVDRVNRLSARLGLDVSTIELSGKDILDVFLSTNSRASEPVSFNSAIMRHVALAASADGVQAVFDGDGADRLFLGMNRYRQYARVQNLYRSIKRSGLAPVVARALAVMPSSEARKVSRLFRQWNAGLRPYPERNIDLDVPFELGHERQIFESAIERHKADFDNEIGSEDFGAFFTYVAIRMCPEMFFHAPAEIYLDFGMTTEPAFWSDDLVELALSIPTAMKLRKGQTKYILRERAAAELGRDYAYLPKIGLQSAYAYLLSTRDGEDWHREILSAIRESTLFSTLHGILPGGKVDMKRLIAPFEWLSSLEKR